MGACTGPVWASSKCTSSSLGKHITLHLPAEFCHNRTIRDRVMTSHPFQDGSHGIAILLPLSVFVISLISDSRNLPAYQISGRHLNPRLRYYYSRFLKTNVRHVEVLFLVPIFRFASPYACHSASAYQISSKSDHLPQSYVVILIFST